MSIHWQNGDVDGLKGCNAVLPVPGSAGPVVMVVMVVGCYGGGKLLVKLLKRERKKLTHQEPEMRRRVHRRVEAGTLLTIHMEWRE